MSEVETLVDQDLINFLARSVLANLDLKFSASIRVLRNLWRILNSTLPANFKSALCFSRDRIISHCSVVREALRENLL